MLCVRCKAEVPDGSPQCPGCGLKLKAAPPPQRPVRPPMPGQAPPGPQPFVPGQQPAAAQPGQPMGQAPGMSQGAPPQGTQRQYPPQGPQGQYPGAPQGQYPPQGPQGQYPGAPQGQYPPQGPQGQYPGAPQGGPGGQPYPPSGPGMMPPPGQYFSPGDPYASPGGGYSSPGDPFAGVGQGAYQPQMGQSSSARRGKDLPVALIAIIAIGIIVIVGSAVAYFTVFNKKGLSEPEQTVMKFFDSMSSGDVATLKTVFAPDSQPDPTTLNMIGSMFSTGMLKYDDIKLKLLNQSATSAKVQLDDASIVVNVGGQKIKQKFSTMYAKGSIIFTLKNEGGKWYMTKDGALAPGLPNIPTMPGSGTSLPGSSLDASEYAPAASST